MTDDYSFDFDFNPDASQKDSEVMVLKCMYPNCVTTADEGKEVSIKLNSLTEGVPECEARFVFAEGYPYANPPFDAINLKVDNKIVFPRVQRNMEAKLMKHAIILQESGDTTIVTSSLEYLSCMMIVSTRSSTLQISTDASVAFSYSMEYVDCD